MKEITLFIFCITSPLFGFKKVSDVYEYREFLRAHNRNPLAIQGTLNSLIHYCKNMGANYALVSTVLFELKDVLIVNGRSGAIKQILQNFVACNRATHQDCIFLIKDLLRDPLLRSCISNPYDNNKMSILGCMLESLAKKEISLNEGVFISKELIDLFDEDSESRLRLGLALSAFLKSLIKNDEVINSVPMILLRSLQNKRPLLAQVILYHMMKCYEKDVNINEMAELVNCIDSDDELHECLVKMGEDGSCLFDALIEGLLDEEECAFSNFAKKLNNEMTQRFCLLRSNILLQNKINEGYQLLHQYGF